MRENREKPVKKIGVSLNERISAQIECRQRLTDAHPDHTRAHCDTCCRYLGSYALPNTTGSLIERPSWAGLTLGMAVITDFNEVCSDSSVTF